MDSRILIESVTPAVDGGRYPAKRIVGEPCVVEAAVFRDGHDLLRAVVRWRHPRERAFAEAAMRPLGNDRWRGEFPLAELGRYVFTIEAWTDRFGSFVAELAKRVEAGQPDVRSEVQEGAALIDAAAAAARGGERGLLVEHAARLRRPGAAADPHEALAAFRDAALAEAMERAEPRAHRTRLAPPLELIVDRPPARFSAWYEMFARSQSREPGRPATLRQAEWRLPDIGAAGMGFDVLYLPPIHPIGRTHRKGPNNTLAAGPSDPGSPWAIGGEAGGHTAIEPALGTLADFDHFVAAARTAGLEVALDFAIQCSPDHPWVREHPEWFYRRPDGTLKHAENPPKKYEDVHPLDFDGEDLALWEAQRAVLDFWIARGVRIFRVDNPHTKPLPFWRWLLDGIREEHPDVIFLSEAFTRPRMMKALAKVGFSQSYTYFTWRHAKAELTAYLTELTQSEMREYFRPNFFTNTPDILSPILQQAGRPAFQLRLVLAATLSPAYGIYSGFELCENAAVPGTEEYLDSEKYQIKTRDWDAPGNLKPLIARLNAIRRENPALQDLATLRFLETDNDQILLYCKATADRSNVLLIAVNLDPKSPHHCTAWVPPDAVGLPAGTPFRVRDLLTGETWEWGQRNYVRLDPAVLPAHVLQVERP